MNPRHILLAIVTGAVLIATGCAKTTTPPPNNTDPVASSSQPGSAPDTSGYAVNVALFAPTVTTSEKECTLSDGTVTTCIEIKTPAIRANNGPYCSDGYAYGDHVAFEPNTIGSCKEFSHTGTVLCVECQPEAATQTWLIPKLPVPSKSPSQAAAVGISPVATASRSTASR